MRTCLNCGVELAHRGPGQPPKRCAACAMVAYPNSSSRLAHTRGASGRNGRYLAVTCWCERSTVWVRQTDLLEGRTESCGLTGCNDSLVRR